MWRDEKVYDRILVYFCFMFMAKYVVIRGKHGDVVEGGRE